MAPPEWIGFCIKGRDPQFAEDGPEDLFPFVVDVYRVDATGPVDTYLVWEEDIDEARIRHDWINVPGRWKTFRPATEAEVAADAALADES